MLDALMDGLYDRSVAKSISKWREEDNLNFEVAVTRAYRKITKNRIYDQGRERDADDTSYSYQVRRLEHTAQGVPQHRDASNFNYPRQERQNDQGRPRYANNWQSRNNSRQGANRGRWQNNSRQGMNRGHWQYNSRQDSPRNPEPGTIDHDRMYGLCYRCHGSGHIARFCPQQNEMPLNGQAVGNTTTQDPDRS